MLRGYKMLKVERQKIIREELQKQGFVLVPALGKLFNCSEETIRRDLEKLEATKRAMREDSDKYVEEHSGDIAPTIDELMNSADTPKKKDDADTDDAADKKNKKKNKK